jgi:hypothetical protein
VNAMPSNARSCSSSFLGLSLHNSSSGRAGPTPRKAWTSTSNGAPRDAHDWDRARAGRIADRPMDDSDIVYAPGFRAIREIGKPGRVDRRIPSFAVASQHQGVHRLTAGSPCSRLITTLP